MQLDRLKVLFPNIEEPSWVLLEQWVGLLKEWNQKINLISRKDIEALEERHLAHCLAITEYLKLQPGATVLDVGTGGGLPGIPMAICYPQAQFTLIDSIGKKVGVVQAIADDLGLKNVKAMQIRAEALKSKFDFVTGRAVKNLPEYLSWVQNNLRSNKVKARGTSSSKCPQNSLANGILYWKGGAFQDELAPLGLSPSDCFDLEALLKDAYFSEKYILYIKAEALEKVRFAAQN